VIAHHEVQRQWRLYSSPPPQPFFFPSGHIAQYEANPHPEVIHGHDPALPDLRYGVNPRNMPQQQLGGPQFWNNGHDVNYWPVHGYDPHPVNMPQTYGGLPPQPDHPLYGNIYYEGHILPAYNQNAYVHQFHPQHAQTPNYPVHGVYARVDHNALLMQRLQNVHEVRRQNRTAQQAGPYLQIHDQVEFGPEFNMQVHQNILNFENVQNFQDLVDEQDAVFEVNEQSRGQAPHHVAQLLQEQLDAEQMHHRQLQQELNAIAIQKQQEEGYVDEAFEYEYDQTAEELNGQEYVDEAFYEDEYDQTAEELHDQDEERRQKQAYNAADYDDDYDYDDPSPPSSPPPSPAGERPYREPVVTNYLGPMDVECPKCHALHFACERLSNSSARNPKFGICCLQGQVNLPAFPEWPGELKRLFHDHRDQQKFIENVRQYNSALAFTSLGVKIHQFAAGAPASFRIHGALHHLMGSLVPPEGNSPSYAQLYIYDAQQATELWHQRNPNLRPEVLRELHDMLSRYHPYANVYKTAMQRIREMPPEQQGIMQIRLHLQPGADARRYNLPTADEIAVIVPGDGSENVQDSRDIVIQHQGGALRRISHLHQSYSSLHYVLLFPRGENDWHTNIPLQLQDGQIARAKKVTQILYYAYHLFTRPQNVDSNNIFYGGRLFQQFVCDAWASIEQNNLTWIWNNQKKLRSDLYQGLQDLAARDANPDLGQQGRSVILPSSHTGSPRFMQQILQDSLAICRDCKKPDLFLTMTANSAWCEIQDNLLPGQRAVDRPELVAHVFFQKKEALLKKVRAGYFGAVAGLVYTIEYQKRGLPHMHLLIFLQEQDKIHTPEQADSFISAQIPDAEETPQLYSAVSKYMLHGPCKPERCMENGKCKKHFPKKYCGQTTMNEDGYPDYARPNNGRTIEKPQRAGTIIFTNADVVPHPPELLVEFNCHINLEVCATIKAVKYVHKYIYKGPDRATLEIQGPVDEVKAYLDSRYVSAMEAAWRILEFPMHLEFPSVYRLSVHLPDRQLIHFDAADDLQEVLGRAADRDTTLTGWFKANLDPDLINAGANDLLYQDFPKKFVWVAKTRKWKLRQSGRAIGRMYTIPPTAGECFFLRLLLTVAKG